MGSSLRAEWSEAAMAVALKKEKAGWTKDRRLRYGSAGQLVRNRRLIELG